MSSVLLQNFPLNLGRNYPLIPLLILFFLEQIPLLILTSTFSPHPLGILSSFPNFPPNSGEIRHFYRPSVVPAPATSYRSSPTGTCFCLAPRISFAVEVRVASWAPGPVAAAFAHAACPRWSSCAASSIEREAAE